MVDLLEKYCPLCGHYYNEVNERTKSDIINSRNIKELGVVMENYFNNTVLTFA